MHPFEQSGRGQNDLPPPFHSDDKDNDKKKQVGGAFPIGAHDKEPLAGDGDETGGMIVGPEHPGFWQGPPQQHPGPHPSFLPPGAVPPGARFDPISPIAPGNPGDIYPSGEPDPDAEPMAGAQVDPLHPGWKAPRGPRPPGAGPSGRSDPFSGGAPFFR